MSDSALRHRGFLLTPRMICALIDDLLLVFTPNAVQAILNGDEKLSEHIQIMRGMAIAANPEAHPQVLNEIVDGLQQTIEKLRLEESQ
jgi:hypothetical protein